MNRLINIIHRLAFITAFMLLFTLQGCSEVDNFSDNKSVLKIKCNGSKLKILAIGNSFTEDATRHLPKIISTLKENDLFIARLFMRSASLQNHWNNYQKTIGAYSFFSIDTSDWIESNIMTINEAMAFCKWDVIVLQQVSNLSGIYSSYQPYLENLIALARECNPNIIIAWHMTWAYAKNSSYSPFANYDYDREKMYDAIVESTEKAKEYADVIIPSGALIEYLRSTPLNTDDDLTRDGYHLEKGYPSLILSHLWHEFLIYPYTQKSSIDPADNSVAWLHDWISNNQDAYPIFMPPDYD